MTMVQVKDRSFLNSLKWRLQCILPGVGVPQNIWSLWITSEVQLSRSLIPNLQFYTFSEFNCARSSTQRTSNKKKGLLPNVVFKLLICFVLIFVAVFFVMVFLGGVEGSHCSSCTFGKIHSEFSPQKAKWNLSILPVSFPFNLYYVWTTMGNLYEPSQNLGISSL